MKDYFVKVIKQKQEARSALKEKILQSKSEEELRSIDRQLDAIDAEIDSAKEQLAKIEAEEHRAAQTPPVDSQRAPNGGEQRGIDSVVGANLGGGAQPQGETRSFGGAAYGFGGGHSEEARAKEYMQKCEQRGADLKDRKPVIFMPDELRNYGLLPQLEKRAISIGSSNLVSQTKYSNVLNPWFEQVSGLVDLVNAIPLNGGESYTQGFEVTSGTGDYTTETGAYTVSDPTFDYVSIGKAKITSYTELTDEVRKLPNVNYQNYVAQQMVISIKKKLGAQIVAGAGGSNAITGIYNAPSNVVDGTTDVTYGAIDQSTLDSIVFGYGGDEAVEGGQWLVLNKKDLAAFAQVRATTGQKLYNITLNGQTGTISSDRSYSVNFVINNACVQHSSATPPATGTATMLYGSPAFYEMPVFSPIEVMESMDFKFSSGQMAFRASMWAGGNVARHNGFVRVKHS